MVFLSLVSSKMVSPDSTFKACSGHSAKSIETLNFVANNLATSNKLEVKTDPEAIVTQVQEPISEEELKAQLEAPAVGGVEDVEVIKKEKPEGEVAEGEEVAPEAQVTEKK